jgi:hypothetical protein
MAGQMQQNWEQELLARGFTSGQQVGARQGELTAFRKMVRKLLEKRFGPLPEEVVQRIEAAELPPLEAVFDRADTLQSIDELGL